jgi:hypothetical protein
MLTVGFANQFYTLWDVNEETVYVTDGYGKHWPSHTVTHFHYIKNISTDLDKVKELYPSLTIDDTLKGITRNWSRDGVEDFSPELFKSGKYSFKTIQEVATIDIKYLLWYLENGWKPKTRELISELPEIKQHFEKLEAEKQAKIASYKTLQSGTFTGTFENNPNNILNEWYTSDSENLIHHSHYHHATFVLEDGTKIFVLFPQVKQVSGLYPYTMGLINNKFCKTKNKQFTLNLNIIHRDCNEYYCYHFATIQ